MAEHRYVYIVEQPEHAGHAVLMLFVDDLDVFLEDVADRGLEPVAEEIHENVRKVTFRDPDGNEISFGGVAG